MTSGMAVRLRVAVLLLGLPSSALAQDFRAAGDFVRGDFQITVTEPDTDRIDCVATDSDCQLMNLAACSLSSRDIEVQVVRPTAVAVQTGELIIWVEEEGDNEIDNDCTIEVGALESDQEIIDRIDLIATSPLVDSPFDFPEDLEATATLTTDNLLKGTGFATAFRDICTTPERAVFRLCFGVDRTTTDGTVAIDEPNGWVRFLVDTEPPDAPTASAVGLDGALQINADIDDDPEDMLSWRVRLREAPEGSDAVDGTGPSDCGSWTGHDVETIDANSASEAFAISAENGVLYEGCVLAVDEAGNESGPSNSFFAMAIDQCDFIECWPSELETGYMFCGAGGASGLLGLLASLGILARTWGRRR